MFINKNELLANEIFKDGNSMNDSIATFFNNDNYLKYLTNFDNINEKQESALKILFCDDTEIEERCEKVTFINNCNINFTNICTVRCGFCAFGRDETVRPMGWHRKSNKWIYGWSYRKSYI